MSKLFDKKNPKITIEEMWLIENFRKLSPDERRKALAFIRKLAERDGEAE